MFEGASWPFVSLVSKIAKAQANGSIDFDRSTGFHLPAKAADISTEGLHIQGAYMPGFCRLI